jgi:predicted membrane protein
MGLTARKFVDYGRKIYSQVLAEQTTVVMLLLAQPFMSPHKGSTSVLQAQIFQIQMIR